MTNSVIASTDNEVIASTLILEAGGEYAEGAMSAVHEVILNRADKRHMLPVNVCLERLQFSCWNNIPVDVGVNKAKKHPRWIEALNIVESPKTNYTKGADHYHSTKVNPYWMTKMKRTTKIGNHIFYRS